MTFFENTQKLIDEAAKIARIPSELLARLQKPDKILEFDVPVGSQKFHGWRVQHNNALGPYKGGIRYHPDSNLDEVEALASLMTWKTSLAGLPYGGGKGAVKIDPKKLSQEELEELSRGFVRAIWKEIGPDKDVPAPDVNTNAQIMDWMVDEYAKLTGHGEPAAFTGKSVEKGGSRGREIATGFGGYVILREFLTSRRKVGTPTSLSEYYSDTSGLQTPTVAIQGFGNVGSNIAKILFDHGFTIIAISDSKGGLYEKEGIDINRVMNIKEKTGIIDRGMCYGVREHNEPCRHFTNEALLEIDADILIPAALENQITAENAGHIKAKVILEMANGPTTPEAEDILISRSVEIIPDILANSGGVVGSYFEWVQSKGQKYWSEQEVLEKIDQKLVEAFGAVVKTQQQYNVSWRLASYIRAITRVANAMK